MSETPVETEPTGQDHPIESPAAAVTPTDPGADTPAVIKALRDDFKEERAKRQAAERRAADAAKETVQSIAKALGLVDDDAADPAKLTASLTTAQADARRAQVELAVFRAANTAGGDPAALLDSTSFLATLKDIDPTDGTAVVAAIATAVEANPRLGAAPSDPKPPAPNPAQGAAASGPAGVTQLTQQDIERMAREGKQEEIVKAKNEGRLNTLLGIK